MRQRKSVCNSDQKRRTYDEVYEPHDEKNDQQTSNGSSQSLLRRSQMIYLQRERSVRDTAQQQRVQRTWLTTLNILVTKMNPRSPVKVQIIAHAQSVRVMHKRRMHKNTSLHSLISYILHCRSIIITQIITDPFIILQLIIDTNTTKHQIRTLDLVAMELRHLYQLSFLLLFPLPLPLLLLLPLLLPPFFGPRWWQQWGSHEKFTHSVQLGHILSSVHSGKKGLLHSSADFFNYEHTYTFTIQFKEAFITKAHTIKRVACLDTLRVTGAVQ